MKEKPLSLKCGCKNQIYATPGHYGVGRCPYCQKKWYFVECPECKTIEVLNFVKEYTEKSFFCVSCENSYQIPNDIETSEVKIFKKEELSTEQIKKVRSDELVTKLIALGTLIIATALLWLYFSLK
ncbi:MAG: hypothetical protein AAB443_04455 [Patescibacteria group bacterium]